MVSNEKKLEILQEYFTDSDGDISLKGLEAPELSFDFSDIKAEKIYNGSQEAKVILNLSQKAKEIENSFQKAEKIDNCYQIVIDGKDKRIKELEEELNNLKNS